LGCCNLWGIGRRKKFELANPTLETHLERGSPGYSHRRRSGRPTDEFSERVSSQAMTFVGSVAHTWVSNAMHDDDAF